jgi:hypothetical protein
VVQAAQVGRMPVSGRCGAIFRRAATATNHGLKKVGCEKWYREVPLTASGIRSKEAPGWRRVGLRGPTSELAARKT